jgi:lipoate-protein ligase A
MRRFDGVENMARDAAMLRRAESGEALMRLYGWTGPWVSLGRSQRSSRALLAGCPAPWVRRPTGGRAVIHGHDITWSLAAPVQRLSVSRRLSAVHGALIQPLARALQGCGQDVRLADPRAETSGGSADCFAFSATVDLVCERTGLKVCGCALRMTQTAVLVQASIPAGEPKVDPAAVFALPAVSGSLPGLDADTLEARLLSEFAFLGAELA